MPPGPYLPPGLGSHLALQVNGWIAVGEVLPEQQCVFILFPCQTVTVVIKVKGLSSMRETQEGMTDRSQTPGAGIGRKRGTAPVGMLLQHCPPKRQVVMAKGTHVLYLEFHSFKMQNFLHTLYN